MSYFKNGIIIRPYQLYRISMWAFVIFLILMNTTLVVLVLRNKPQIKLIAIENGQTRMVPDKFDEILEEEELRFLKKFIKSFYTRSKESVDDLQSSLNFFEPQLYASIQPQVDKYIELINSSELAETIHIVSIQGRDDEDSERTHYSVEFEKTTEGRGGQLEKSKRLVQIDFIRVQRSRKNPWGLLVKTIKEELSP